MLNTSNNNLTAWLQPEESFITSVRPLLDFFDHIDDYQLLKEQQKIQELNSMIDKSNFIEWKDWCIKDLCKTHPCGPGGHILEDGHCTVAKKVLEYYNNSV